MSHGVPVIEPKRRRAVRSMSQSWHNFLYNSFDPAGFISVDKPPVALWIQVASVNISVLLLVMMGVAFLMMWGLHLIVQRTTLGRSIRAVSAISSSGAMPSSSSA